MKSIEIMQQIQEHETMKQILADSYGGIVYNVANKNKYETTELKELWNQLNPNEQDSMGGIIKGAMNFIKEED